MKYDVFVSYSVIFSSRAYELSAQLSRENLMCYLDCVESGFSLNDYTRGLLSESRIHVLLVGPGFVTTPYAIASLQCAKSEHKTMMVLLADGTKLPDELLGYCVVSSETTLVSDIMSALGNATNVCDEVSSMAPSESAMQSDSAMAFEFELETGDSIFTDVPFLSSGEEVSFEAASQWASATSTVYSDEEDVQVAEFNEDEPSYTEEGFGDDKGNADDEDDEEELVCTERRGEEWLSLPPDEASSPVSEISPELQKFIRIVGWVVFALWLLRLCE